VNRIRLVTKLVRLGLAEIEISRPQPTSNNNAPPTLHVTIALQVSPELDAQSLIVEQHCSYVHV
jgi:hypothetical protein